MDYEKGEPLRDWIKQRGSIEESQLLKMFLPLLEGLDVVHKARVLHRDIKPANIYVREEDGSLVLLDFGAARYTSSGDSRSLTSIVTPGFAPFEQYHTHGAQGPWSDLYALGGVLYWLVTGEKPLEAPSRVRHDAMPSALSSCGGRYSERLLRAIDWALTPDEVDRPKSVSQFKAVLVGEVDAPPLPISVSQSVQADRGAAKLPGKLPLGLAAVGLVLLIAGGGVLFAKAGKSMTETVAQTPTVPQGEGVQGNGDQGNAESCRIEEACSHGKENPQRDSTFRSHRSDRHRHSRCQAARGRSFWMERKPACRRR
ncbi:MAG: serine/threonine protein kinase [Rhodocyclaceae bacterium]|nr:serine/threonine protein kinase [Rhodocyclaceae bacterium]